MNVHNGTKFDVPIFAKIHWGVLKKKKSFKNCAPFRNGSQKGGSRESSFFSIKEVACPIFARCSTFFLKETRSKKGSVRAWEVTNPNLLGFDQAEVR